MIPELLSFEDCCGKLPCNGGANAIQFSITFQQEAFDAMVDPTLQQFYFGSDLGTGTCLPFMSFKATAAETALAVYNYLHEDPRYVAISSPYYIDHNQVDWLMTAESVMEALNLTYDEAVAYISEQCNFGFSSCVVYGELYTGIEPIVFQNACVCDEAVAENAPECCDDVCYQTHESFNAANTSTNLASTIGSLLDHLAEYYVGALTFPAAADVPAVAFPDITDWGQSCYDFSCVKTTYAVSEGILERFAMFWLPKAGNPCLHAYAAEAYIIVNGGVVCNFRAALASHYLFNGVADPFNGGFIAPPAPLGVWDLLCDVLPAANVRWKTFIHYDTINNRNIFFPCNADDMGSKAVPRICEKPMWCMPIRQNDRLAFVLEESVRNLLPGTYSVMLGIGINSGCNDPLLVRVGKVFVTPNPQTGRNVGFLDVQWPYVAAGCFKLVISSDSAEDYPPIEVPAGANILTIGSGGSFDTSTWHSGITATAGVTLAQYGTTYRSPFFSLRATPGNFSNGIFITDPINGLVTGENYVFEIWVYGKAWPTNGAKNLTIGVAFNGSNNVFTNTLVLPSNSTPLNQWTLMQLHIAAGTIPNGFQLKLEWSDPPFGSFPDYDVLFDDMSLRLAPYTIPATAPSQNVLLCSGCIDGLLDDCFTGMVRFSNNGNGLGYPYSLAPAGFKQSFRVEWQRKEYSFGADRSTYTNSRGETVPLHVRMRKDRDYEVGYAPERIHEILALAIEHDSFEVKMAEDPRWEFYVNEKDYKTVPFEHTPKFGLRKGLVSLRLRTYQKTNAFC